MFQMLATSFHVERLPVKRRCYVLLSVFNLIIDRRIPTILVYT